MKQRSCLGLRCSKLNKSAVVVKVTEQILASGVKSNAKGLTFADGEEAYIQVALQLHVETVELDGSTVD